jgi:hypothetical protein
MTDTILRAWTVSPTIEVRLVENDAWNLDTVDSEYRYRVVTAVNGVEMDEETFDDHQDAACECCTRARVLRENCEE